MISVDDVSFLVNAKAAIRVAVMSNAYFSVIVNDHLTQVVNVSRATIIIDVNSIGISAKGYNICAQSLENLRHSLISCTISAIKNNLHAIKTLIGCINYKVDIIFKQVMTIFNVAELLISWTRKFIFIFNIMNNRFNLVFNIIRQLIAVATKKFNTVVIKRIV